MPTAVGTESNPVQLLHNLIQLDFDAIVAYDLAADRVQDRTLRRQLQAFGDDHRRHVENLGRILHGLGEPVPEGPDSQVLLTSGQVLVASPFGDRAILLAMALNEDDTNTAYRRAVAHKGMAAEIDAALAEALEDERRHAAWIEGRLRRRAA